MTEKLIIGYLGPAGTFTEIAVRQVVADFDGDNYILQPVKTITKVCESVATGGFHYGVVPIENSTVGDVKLTLDALAILDLKIRKEVVTPITHCLYHLPNAVIRQIRSKPEAIGQCLQYLKENFPHISKGSYIADDSTSAAVLEASKDPSVAAIGSQIAAEALGLGDKLIRTVGIETQKTNATKFIVVGGKDEESLPTGTDRTSFIIRLAHQPGSLLNFLDIIADNGINLSKIRSFKGLDYGATDTVSFLISIDSHQDDLAAHRALSDLGNRYSIKMLGSYPMSDYIPPETSEELDMDDIIQQVKKDMQDGDNGKQDEVVAIFTLKDRVAALRDVVKLFQDIQLEAINSVPTRVRLGEYAFYSAFRNHMLDKEGLLKKMLTQCTRVALLS